MRRSISTIKARWAAQARRVGSVAACGLALALGGVLGASAQSPNDVTVPTPHSWKNVHAGGVEVPAITSSSGGATTPDPNLLDTYLMGTPTGTVNGKFDEISSFLLGNYNPTQPPSAQGTGVPNNFRDAAPFNILQWFAPFAFTYPNATTTNGSSSLSVDDSAGSPSFTTPAGTWTNETAGTATDSEYVRVGVVASNGATGSKDVAATNGATATALWKLTLPASTTTTNSAGFYVVTFHIPDAGTVSSLPEGRITDAHYVITTPSQTAPLANVRISQTEANADQLLAGPFFLQAGQEVDVTLDNTTQNAIPANAYVVADSVALQPGFGANVQSTPTAVDETEYPEIQNALYYGVLGQRYTTVNGVAQSYGSPDTVPFGNQTVVTPFPAGNYTGDTAANPQHRIRQLVYFGRQENIVLQDVNGNLVDDNGNSVTTPVIRQVGAIYCVDGFTGGVVWRYQTPAILTKTTTTNGTTVYQQAEPSREVFSSPAIARVNVIVHYYESVTNNGTTTVKPTYYHQTRLVVIVGDNNGMVYCLDAIGNRNGTSNNNSVSANDQPIYNPTAGLNEVTTTAGGATIHAHVGTTTPYWIYRPDPTMPRDITSGKVKTADPTSDLPVPGSFGTASPVIYVDPSDSPEGTYPGDTTDNTTNTTDLTNAAVYIGNSNGVLYKLDAEGIDPATFPATTTQSPYPTTEDMFNMSLPIADPSIPAAVNDPTGQTIPTCQPDWWLPLNGSKTVQNGSATTGGGYESIVSAPAFDPVSNTTASISLQNGPTAGMVYVTSADDADNEGRLYAVSGSGPVDINGNTLAPGSTGYNDKAISNWEFPNRYARPMNAATGQPARSVRPALGSITGSPVVFTNPDGVFDIPTPTGSTLSPAEPTRIYFAASSGLEDTGNTSPTAGVTRPDVEETGRIWAVEADAIDIDQTTPFRMTPVKFPGDFAWAFPSANDPNLPANDNVAQPAIPVGAFRFATPAIGLVQFPTVINANNTTSPATAYTHTDEAGTRADIKGKVVPMLYAGSAGNGAGQQAPRFYGLDLDGTTDAERTIFQDTETVSTTSTTGTTTTTTGTLPGIASPGGNIETSAALVVNSSTSGGNGGALFVGIGTDLYQISATPETSQDPTATQAIFPTEAIVAGTGSISSPSVAGASVFDEVTALGGNIPGSGIYSAANVTDWVYFSDSGLGLAEGITPENQNGGIGTGLTEIVPPVPPGLQNFVIPQFPLYTYEFDGTTAYPATTQDMTKANPIGGPLPLFEWGQNVYIRIGNVIPPNPGDPAAGTDNAAYHIYDPETISVNRSGSVALNQAIFFTDGGPVTIQISDIDNGTNQPLQTDSGQVPTTILTSLDPTKLTPAETAGTPPPNGFINRTDPSTGTSPNAHFIVGPPPHNNEQLGAAITTVTQPISQDRNIKINLDNGWIGAYTYAIRDGSGRRNTPGTTRRVVNATQIAKAYHFVLNAGGTAYVPTFLGSVTLQTTITSGGEASVTNPTTGVVTPVAIDAVDQPTFGILNPLAVRGGGTPLFTGAGGAKQIGDIVGPFAGVNSPVQTADLPALGNGNRYPSTTSDVPLNGVLANNTTPNYTRGVVVVSVGDINHGSTGDNTVPKATAAPTGTHTIPVVPASKFGQYSLDIADRSALGLSSESLQNVTIQAQTLRWNDNNAINGISTNGAGSIVNYLPWETLPHSRGAGSNTSLDYPDIASSNLGMYLYSNSGALIGNVTNKPASPDPAQGTTVVGRTVYADPVQEQVSVPRYQPANLQLFDTTLGRITPDAISTSNDEYPMGYVARQNIYVDSNHNGQYDAGEAYRTIQTFTGVPVDMTTTIENSTTDLGKLPQSFGVQTQASALGMFTPYNTNYQQFFKPLTILNRGNTNLLNVHLDQLISAPGEPSYLPLLSDALDPLATVPAYDANGGITGPRSNGEQPYLLRSSLDPDLVTAYGRNPGIVAGYSSFFPGAPFHKARVNEATPTTLYVPDSPDSNPLPRVTVPTLPSGSTVYAAPPYVSLAVPLGTPVGTYTQNVRLFEGLDPSGYTNIYGTGTNYVPILPPKYGGVEMNGATTTAPTIPNTAPTPANLNDVWTLPGGISAQPYSTPTVVKTTVTETRITDGASRGNLPQVDTGGAGTNGAATADFLPSAFRSPSGDISLYWTSARDATATQPYSIFGANLPFTASSNPAPGYFSAATPKSRWWNAITLPTPTNGFYSTLSIVSDPTGAATPFAFVQNIVPTNGTYADALYCYPVGANGALGTTAYPVSLNPGQAYNGVKGVTFVSTTPFTDPVTNTAITNPSNLWAFWYGGARGRSAIYYSSTTTGSSGTPGTFTTPAVLPIPAGLSSVADPNPVFTYAPDTSGTAGTAIPVIEVTYTGVAPDGNSDIYVSRYRPYLASVRQANGTTTTQIALALVAAPPINEQLALTPGNLYWQARDVAWARADTINVNVVNAGGNTSLLQDTSQTQNADGSYPLRAGIKATYDRQTGTLVYTGVTIGTTAITTVYVDLARGRVRFNTPLPAAASVYATFSPSARRITTDPRADTQPVSFLDEQSKENEANTGGVNQGTVQANRYWFLWRKSGAPGTSTTPTLWYKTQRLTVVLHDQNNNPISIQLTGSTPTPNVTVKMGNTTLYSPTGGSSNVVDVDWARGRLYFPIAVGTTAMEGQAVTISGTDSNGNALYPASDNVHWLDEPRFNETSGTSLAPNPPTTTSAQAAAAIGETPIPIDTIVNESNVTAFLDPLASPTSPHKVWLFWNSTRNGTADLYYETIDPLFAVKVGQ